MNQNEEAHAKFFNSELVAIAQMEPLERRARLEDLQKIAAEVRARAAAHIEQERRERKGKKILIETSVSTDDFSREAINKIQTRRERMSREERLKQNMMNKLGLNQDQVDSLMSASKLLEAKNAPAPEKTNVLRKNVETFNPFAPKSEDRSEAPETNVTIVEEVTTTIIVSEPEQKKPFNPFQK